MKASPTPNALIYETSLYLQQHAYNPVQWYPWSEAVLQKAKEEDKPILLSIGYAACHWCHVMERESFEDEATAALMNQYFINIKVDREERPDLDHIYMDAVQAISGSGGWPLNVFLTPDAKPFFGGTYFPPQRVHGRLSWKEILTNIHNAYVHQRTEVEEQANKLASHLNHANSFTWAKSTTDNAFSKASISSIHNQILKQADTIWGGFGKAPKFPQTFTINNLLYYYLYEQQDNSLKQAVLSLEKMCNGGIYDHVQGGFARYSTDDQWLAPHFEKMLYDNALIISSLALAYQITSNHLLKNTIHQTLSFIQDEMMTSNYGFYCAFDADSEGVEGKYYVWQKEELDALLGDDAAMFCAYFNVEENGNWEGTNILWKRTDIVHPLIQDLQNNTDDFEDRIHACLRILKAARKKRIPPQLDTKIILGWNALMNQAFVKAYNATQKEEYLFIAEKNMQYLTAQFYQEQQWHHVAQNNTVKYFAFLDDLAYLASALITLYEATANTAYLHQAKEIVTYCIDQYTDAEQIFFYYTSKHQTDVLLRKKEIYDGATPSGNSVMAENLIQLSIFYDIPAWRERAESMLQTLIKPVVQYPTSFGVWVKLLMALAYGLQEIVITGVDAKQTLPEILKHRVKLGVLQCFDTAENFNWPLLAGKEISNSTVFYLCSNYACTAPQKTLSNFLGKM